MKIAIALVFAILAVVCAEPPANTYLPPSPQQHQQSQYLPPNQQQGSQDQNQSGDNTAVGEVKIEENLEGLPQNGNENVSPLSQNEPAPAHSLNADGYRYKVPEGRRFRF